MPVYINNWEHYSSVFTSAEAFRGGFIKAQNGTTVNSQICALNEPLDLFEYIEKRGAGKKSNFTKVTSYIAKKLCNLYIPDSRLGIIMATEFGNIVDMCNLGTLAHSSTEPISAQIFPNSTISSATVTASIALQAKGFNITLNSGVLSFYYALMIAKSYIEDDKLDACIVIVGDDYNQFAIEDINTSYMKFNDFLSTINGIMLSKYKNELDSYYIKDVVIAPEDLFEGSLTPNSVYGYYKHFSGRLKESSFELPNTYIGPSIAFLEMLQGLYYLKNTTASQEVQILFSDSGLIASLDIGKET